jgi:hypothetical protein
MVNTSNAMLQVPVALHCFKIFSRFRDHVEHMEALPLVEVATWRLLASSISLFSVILLFMAVS